MGFGKKTAKGRLDKYYHLAKDQGYRARSAFKLLHLNKRYAFLENAKAAVDLCAAPGGWLQVAAKCMPKSHILIGVDLVPIKPIPGVITIVGDITTDKCRSDIRKELKDWKVDVVLHDGAPNVGKAWLQDAYSQAELVLSAFKLACDLLVPKGVFVTKVFRSKEYNSLLWVFNQLFESVDATKPASSRSVSAEIFVVCRGFKAPSKADVRFFDPKFVFQDSDTTKAEAQASFKAVLLGKGKRDRFREGYEDGQTLMYKEKPLSAFLSADDPLAFLSDANRLIVDRESDSVRVALEDSGRTSRDILESFNDIKILGRRELKDLLRWRKSAIASMSPHTASPEMPPHGDAEESEDLDKIHKEALKTVKKEKRKVLEKHAKSRMRMQLQMDNTADIEMNADLPEFSEFPEMSSQLVGHDSESSRENSNVDDAGCSENEDFLGAEVDKQYKQFVAKSASHSSTNELDASAHGLASGNSDCDSPDESNAEPAERAPSSASAWFKNALFEEIRVEPKQTQVRDRKKEQQAKSEEIEFVPKETPVPFQQASKDALLDVDGVQLAMQYTSNRKRGKSDLIDNSFNRYAFGDSSSLPEWFRDDEKKHSRPQMPVSKEAVAVLKEKMRILDSKPIKKVLEAKGRQRRRAERKIELLKKKANSISASEEVSDKAKSEKIQRLAKKSVKEERKRKVIVSKGALKGTKGRPKGVKGRYKRVSVEKTIAPLLELLQRLGSKHACHDNRPTAGRFGELPDDFCALQNAATVEWAIPMKVQVADDDIKVGYAWQRLRRAMCIPTCRAVLQKDAAFRDDSVHSVRVLGRQKSAAKGKAGCATQTRSSKTRAVSASNLDSEPREASSAARRASSAAKSTAEAMDGDGPITARCLPRQASQSERALDSAASGSSRLAAPVQSGNIVLPTTAVPKDHPPRAMEDSANLDQLTLRLDENEELNALTLTTLLNSGVEEALSNLSPAQLIQLEKNVQKLKKQKTPITPLRKRVDADSSAVPEKKRKASPASEEDLAGHASRSTGGQYMNLPASAPHVEIRDGIEWLLFTYSTKGHIQEYCIRIDIDDLTLDEIPTDFKNDNCVYPRALVIRDSYSGNRFEYESSVNDLAWKLTWMNADVLSGKRGLIQRAVDSYRNRTPESRSRRVLRQQKLQEGNLRRRSTSEHDVPADGKTQKSITLQYTSKNGETSRIKLRVDIDSVNLADLDDDFRRANCLYPQAACDQSNYGTGRYEYESSCNEIAWKLTWLNAGKLANQPNILQKAVDAYRARFETGKHHEYFSSGDHASIHAPADGLLTKGADFSEMVAHTLQQVLGHAQDDEIHSQVSLEDHLATSHNFKDDDDDDDDFDHPRTVSTAELLGGL